MTSQDWIKIAEEFESPYHTDGKRKDTTATGLCGCAQRLGFNRYEVTCAVQTHTGKTGYLYPIWYSARNFSNLWAFDSPHTQEHDIARASIAREIAAKLEKGQA